MPECFNVDEAVLADPANEERQPLDYYINGVAFLGNWLETHGLAESHRMQELLALCQHFESQPAERESGQEVEAANAAHELGGIGAAVYHLRHRESPQMRLELERFATDGHAFIGTHYLFYIAGRLAARGHTVDFVDEAPPGSGEKRPDVRAERDGRQVFIEANAKQPRVLADTPERLWYLVRDVVEEKRQKFTDPRFHPGVIVTDISPVKIEANETGLPALLELRRDLCEPLDGGGFIYPLYADATWKERPHDQGNVFAYAVEQFEATDPARYGLTLFLLTAARRAFRLDGGQIAYPKRHVLLVRRDCREQALLDLSRFVYLI